MSEPIGWNVYYGSNGHEPRFDHFEPNEPALAREAQRFAGQVEAFAGGASRDRKPFGSFAIEGTIALEFEPGAAEKLLEMLRPRCGALLFPLPSPVQVVAETGSATFLMDSSRLGPVQGPQPAVCALDKDHRIGWHWDGRGTWWKA